MSKDIWNGSALIRKVAISTPETDPAWVYYTGRHHSMESRTPSFQIRKYPACDPFFIMHSRRDRVRVGTRLIPALPGWRII